MKCIIIYFNYTYFIAKKINNKNISISESSEADAAYRSSPRWFQTPRLRNSDVNSDADAHYYQSLKAVCIMSCSSMYCFVKYYHLMFIRIFYSLQNYSQLT